MVFWKVLFICGNKMPTRCNRPLLHLVGILFPHINDDARSKSHQSLIYLVTEVVSLVVRFVAYVQKFQPRHLLFRDAAWFSFKRFQRKQGQYLEDSSHLFRWHAKVSVQHHFVTLVTAVFNTLCVVIDFLRSNHELFSCWKYDRWQVACSFIQVLISTLFHVVFHFVAPSGDCAFGDIYLYRCGPGSVVGIATAYGLDGPGIESRWGEIFRTSPDRPWGPTSLLYNGYRVFPGGKLLPGRDAEPSPPSSAEV